MFELHLLLLLYIFIYIFHPFTAGLTEEPPAVQGNSNRRSVSTLRPSAKDAYMLFQVRHLSITVHQRLTKHSRVSPGSGIAFGNTAVHTHSTDNKHITQRKWQQDYYFVFTPQDFMLRSLYTQHQVDLFLQLLWLLLSIAHLTPFVVKNDWSFTVVRNGS